jgi:flagellin-like protein
MEQKGVSPVVGTILLIAITVALAAVVATLVSGLGGRGTPPSAMLTVTAKDVPGDNNIELTISHEGGDDLVLADLQIKATKNLTTGAMAEIKGTDLGGPGVVGATFSVGEKGVARYSAPGIGPGDTITVFIIHIPSKQKIFSSTSVVVT